MSKVIPKEQLTAYQRWELAAFEEGRAPDPQEAAQGEGGREMTLELEGGDATFKVALPTAEELERIHQEAWQEGYDLGVAEGRKAGFETGKQDGERYARQLRSLTEALETERLRQDETVAQEVLSLALSIAQQVVGSTLRVKPDLILATIREALLSLPALSGHHRIVVHPDSAEVVREWLAQEHNHLSWKVSEDDQLEPGGFRFETAHSELDASMKARWREIVECLGANVDWME